MWSQYERFMAVVQQTWGKRVAGNVMYQIATKFRYLRKAFRPLRAKFSNAIQQVEELRAKLVDLQNQKAMDPNNSRLVELEQQCKKDFLFWNKAARSFILQKTKATWLVEGDANTRFFHATMRQRHYKQKIYTITTETGELITDYDGVLKHFQDYYQQMLGIADPLNS